MKRLISTFLAMVLIVGPAFIISCSDDDDEKVTGPTPGDLNDPAFLKMSDIISEGFYEYDGLILDLSMGLTNLIPDKVDSYNPYKAMAQTQFDSLVWSYSYSNYWHIFTVWARTITEYYEGGLVADTFIFSGLDSLRFGNAEGPMQYPDSTTNTLNIRAHIEVSISSGDNYASIASDARFDITGTPEVELYINGQSADSLLFISSDDSASCEGLLTTNQTATGLYLDSMTLASEGGCPRSGTLRVIATADLSCMADSDSLDIVGTWNILFTFNNGMLTITYNDGTHFWEITESCGGGLGKSNWGEALKRLRN